MSWILAGFLNTAALPVCFSTFGSATHLGYSPWYPASAGVHGEVSVVDLGASYNSVMGYAYYHWIDADLGARWDRGSFTLSAGPSLRSDSLSRTFYGGRICFRAMGEGITWFESEAKVLSYSDGFQNLLWLSIRAGSVLELSRAVQLYGGFRIDMNALRYSNYRYVRSQEQAGIEIGLRMGWLTKSGPKPQRTTVPLPPNRIR